MSLKHYDWSDFNSPPEIEEHSLVKHKMLAFYLERYIKVLTADPRYPTLKLWLIDGFAGGGQYSIANSDERHDGSPLILLKTVDKMRLEVQTKRENPFNIDAKYFFVEKDANAYNFLKNTLKKECDITDFDKNIRVINDSFVSAFPKILQQIQANKQRNPRCIFLLDQYGYKNVPFATLKTIFATFPNAAEVLLTFATESLISYMSEGRFQTAMKNAGLESIITKELIDSFRDTASYEKKSARLIGEQILATHILENSGARFFTPFFIVSKKSRRSFLLIHLSCNWRARDEMNQTHWELHNHAHHYGMAGLKNFRSESKLIATLGYDIFHNEEQASFEYQFDDQAEKQTYDALREELPEKIWEHKGQKITVGDLLIENCNYTPANSKHFKKTLEELIKYKSIRVFSSDGKHERFTHNTIHNDDIIEFKQSSLF